MGDGLVVTARVDTPARLDVELTCPPGVTALFGPSGSGKSTTLGVIAGLVRPANGRVALGADVLFDAATGVDVPPHRRRCALVPQSLALFPHLTAKENVLFAIPKARKGRASEAAAWLDRLHVAGVADRRPATFSGGEGQRVALARALASEPRALLLDEPFNALDDDLAARIGDELVRLVDERGIVALLVTHDRAHATRFAKHAVVLREGRVAASGSTTNVLSVSGLA